MFKPASSALRSATRALPRSAVRNRAASYRRALSTAVRTPTSTEGRRVAAVTTVGVLGIFAGYQLLNATEVHAEAPPLSLDEARKAKLSSQHVQVKNSLENPGVYVWGDNRGHVIDPTSKEKAIKTPRRLKFFDNVILRDLKLDRTVGVAVNDRGDILQWGDGYAVGITEPEATLKGKDIERAEITDDKIVALSRDRTVYTLPIAKEYQLDGLKPTEPSWVPGVSSQSPVAYRVLQPELGYFESVSDISAGRDHALLLTNKGRIFSAAAAFKYPEKGQLGIKGLTWQSRPTDKPYDYCHEVTALKDRNIKQVAAGDYHSLALDNDGRVWCFGDNINGQLGLDFSYETSIVDVPNKLPLKDLYPNKTVVPKVTKIAAGGANSYFMVDVNDTQKNRTTADLLACGIGIHGNLGNGRWTHVQGPPTKINALSGLSEYDEKTNQIVPIRIKKIAVGATHSAAIMSNYAQTSASSKSNDTNFGNDVLVWGNNEFFQLGTGKRNNTNTPVYIPPLDSSLTPDTAELELTGSSSSKDLTTQSGIIGGAGDAVGSGRSSRKDQVHRFQLTPEGKVKGGGKAEQRIECGRGVTAVYSARV